MGISMRCPKTGSELRFDLGGLLRLRERVADMVSPEVGEHYRSLKTAFQIPMDERRAFWDRHDDKTCSLVKQRKLSTALLDFLYSPDCEANLDAGSVAEVLEVATSQKMEDDTYYNRTHENAATWQKFLDLLRECVKTNSGLEWY